MVADHSRKSVSLPPRPFFYTLDQIAVILNLEQANLIRNGYIFLEGRTIGAKRRDQMMARNIAPADQKPEWRIIEQEFIRWLKVRGFRFYERNTVLF